MMNLDSWKEYADAYVQVARAMIEKGGLPPSPATILGFTGVQVSKKRHVSPPRLDKLGWMLPQLPPLIARCRVGDVIPGLSASMLAAAERRGGGPRVRYKCGIGKGAGAMVLYPAAYLLEWMESKGLTVDVRSR